MATGSFSDIQQKLVQWLGNMVPENQSLVDILADLLQISTDSAYRRLRGDTAFDIHEVAAVCRHFKLSFDSLCSSEDMGIVSFQYKPMNTEADFITYLSSIRDDIKRIAANNGEVIYAAEDIPLFHHFRLPDLAAFKIFYWLRSIISDESFRHTKFTPEVISSEVKDLCREIYDSYSRVPSIEIWTDVTAVSNILQIRYYWESGIFEQKEDALHICELALEEIAFVEKQAESSVKLDYHGKKVMPEVNYSLYHSDIEIANNTIMASIGETDWLYLTHNTLNKMVTSNKEFCTETKNWLKHLMQKSTLISRVAEKQRYQFFNGIKLQLDAIKEKIYASEKTN